MQRHGEQLASEVPMKRALTLLALATAATTFAHGQNYAAEVNAYRLQNLPGMPQNLDPRDEPAPNSQVTMDQGNQPIPDTAAPAASGTLPPPKILGTPMDPRNGPVNMPGWPNATQGTDARGRQVEMSENGKCQAVRYGDTVNFTMRIEGVADARRVYTQLAMGLGGHPKMMKADFLLATSDSFGGGGMGRRDAGDPQLYHFHFVVPDVRSGIYHSASVGVRAIYSESSVDEGAGVGLNRHAHDQVRNYCLAVFGGEGGEHRPVVTEFLPGEIVRPEMPPVRPLVR